MGMIIQNGKVFATGEEYQVYSTEEHIVGEWIDGKTLYEITLINTTATAIGPNDWATIPWSNEPTDIEALIGGENHQGDIPNSYATVRVAYTGGHVKMAALYSGTFGANASFTIRYTKSNT